VATDLGADPFGTLTKKSASWRRKRPALNGPAPTLARSLGITIPTTQDAHGEEVLDIRAGELSDLIDSVFASRRLDSIVAKMAGGLRQA
jgi:hypothetical protein